MTAKTDLYPRICSFENIFLAYRKARKGKRGKESTASFEYDQEKELLKLRGELEAGTWQPGPYHSFYIHDPKRRLISAAPFRDRVVHHTLCNVIEPIWERRFIFDSYANCVGKGTHKAILRCNEFSWRYGYVLQCDVEQFFPSIDHQILFGQLARLVDDPRTLELIRKILKSGEGVQAGEYEMRWFNGDGMEAQSRPRGLPIRWVLIRDPKGSFKSQALLCTELTADPEQIVKWFVMRWQLEVTFHEVRDHLGVETQRQWSDWAILRTTPALLALFSLVTLLANTHALNGKIPVRQAAWYSKPLPTFSDALALVRQELWQHRYFQLSQKQYDVRKLHPALLEYLQNAAFYTP